MFHLIHNPYAHRGRSKEYLEAFLNLLDAEGREYALYSTTGKNHATEITKEIIAAGGRNIIILGGDGTVHEVVNGFGQEDDVVFGILPAGTGNDVANMLGQPFGEANVRAAAQAILDGNVKPVDFIKENESGEQSVLFFSYGIAAQMVILMDKFAKKNKATYYRAMMMIMFGLKAATYHFSVDGGETQTVKADFLGLHNCIHGGGGMTLAHDAIIDDGYVELFVVENRSMIRRILNFISILTGKIHLQPNVRLIKVKKVVIDSPDDNYCCVAGEIRRVNRLDLEVVEKGLKVFG
jgi:YegS/Rv2252/BmrU family lipid kinase